MNSKKIVMISAFPPPMGGAAKNSLKMFQAVSALGSDVTAINSSPGVLSHSRGLTYHFKRIKLFLFNIFFLMKALLCKSKKIYFVPDGGFGLIYTAFYIALSRLFFVKYVIHYRNFSYINDKSILLNFILLITKGRAHHVFLDEYMQEKFKDMYPIVQLSASSICYNTGFLDFFEEIQADKEYSPSYPVVVGHLSNLCFEKGLYDFRDLVERVNQTPLKGRVEFRIAGGAVSKEDQDVIDALSTCNNVRVLGHIEGQRKKEFFQDCDFFVFPTRFDQEAQPNVVWEALAAGAYPVCYDRGSVSWMLRSCTGLVVNENNISSNIIKLIDEFDVSSRAKLKRNVQSSLSQIVSIGQRQFTALVKKLDEA